MSPSDNDIFNHQSTAQASNSTLPNDNKQAEVSTQPVSISPDTGFVFLADAAAQAYQSDFGSENHTTGGTAELQSQKVEESEIQESKIQEPESDQGAAAELKSQDIEGWDIQEPESEGQQIKEPGECTTVSECQEAIQALNDEYDEVKAWLSDRDKTYRQQNEEAENYWIENTSQDARQEARRAQEFIHLSHIRSKNILDRRQSKFDHQAKLNKLTSRLLELQRSSSTSV